MPLGSLSHAGWKEPPDASGPTPCSKQGQLRPGCSGPCLAEFKFLQDGDFTTETSRFPPFSKLENSRLPGAPQQCPPEYPHYIHPPFKDHWDFPPKKCFPDPGKRLR